MTNELNRFLDDLEFGYNWTHEFLGEINKAVTFSAKIPKDYWREIYEDYWKELFEKFGVWHATKGRMKKFHDELVVAIIEFLAPDDTKKDFNHYISLFHALSMLGVPKNCSLLKTHGENKYYDFMFAVWQLDNVDNWDQVINMLRKMP